MSDCDLDRIHRERLDANTRYNRALTALDKAIVDCRDRPLTRDDFDRLSTALVVFLQQITAFVETSDRKVVCDAGERFERLAAAAADADELRTQLNVVQRAVQALSRQPPDSPPAAGVQSRSSDRSAVSFGPAAGSDYKYLAFEDEFRGSPESVAARLRQYVPIFSGADDVVDLGCGRGELLAALKEAGISARGVDTNGDMVAAARERGLDAVHGDALDYLTSAANESIGGVVATQVIEHLEPWYLVSLLDTAARKTRPGAPIVLETINPACWLAFFSSYVRDLTHVRPVHPETLQYLLRASGFERVELRYSAPVPDHMKMKTMDLAPALLASSEPYAIAIARLAHTINANSIVLNNLMFTHMDYAAIGYRLRG